MLIICDALDTLLYTLRRPYFRKMENEDALVCISESIPEPTVEWVFRDLQSDRYDMFIEVTVMIPKLIWSFSNAVDVILDVQLNLLPW